MLSKYKKDNKLQKYIINPICYGGLKFVGSHVFFKLFFTKNKPRGAAAHEATYRDFSSNFWRIGKLFMQVFFVVNKAHRRSSEARLAVFHQNEQKCILRRIYFAHQSW